MLAEILNAFIFRMRMGLRSERATLFAGHGFADANYRPARLPFASIVGPLNLEIEPDRDLPRNAFIFSQSAGYLAGLDILAANLVPLPGSLLLLLDGEVTLHVELDFGGEAGEAFTDERARRIARAATLAIRAAVNANLAQIDSETVTDPNRISELRGSSLRWQRGRHRFLLVSGRHQVIDEADRLQGAAESSVGVLTVANNIAASLGFTEESLAVPGRISRNRISQPTAVAVDVRLDLWAGGQQQLADLLERWAAITPTRGQLLLSPGVLRANAMRGSSQISMLPGCWPASEATLALMDGATGFDNRVENEIPALSADATIDGNTLRIVDTGTATFRVWDAPALPPPDRLDHPALNGYALTVELSTEGAPSNGESFQIVTLSDLDGANALSVTATTSDVSGTLLTVLQLNASREDGDVFSEHNLVIAPDLFASGITLHIVLDAIAGGFRVWADGVPLTTLAPGSLTPVNTPGIPVGGDDMQLLFGGGAGASRPFRIRRAELLARPFGPLDPRMTATTASAARWQVGDPVGLANNSFLPQTTEPFNAVVIAIEGDDLILDRELPKTYSRSATVVFKRSLFFAQRQWRRRDDLMNRLFRLSVEYRVSAFLEDRVQSNSAPIVETTEVDVRDINLMLGERAAQLDGVEPIPPLAPRHDRPGVHTEIVEPPPMAATPARTAGTAVTEP